MKETSVKIIQTHRKQGRFNERRNTTHREKKAYKIISGYVMTTIMIRRSIKCEKSFP